jgi:hypothetical protein
MVTTFVPRYKPSPTRPGRLSASCGCPVPGGYCPGRVATILEDEDGWLVYAPAMRLWRKRHGEYHVEEMHDVNRGSPYPEARGKARRHSAGFVGRGLQMGPTVEVQTPPVAIWCDRGHRNVVASP